MIHHTIDTCPDDFALLSAKLDSLSRAGARIISVMWQPRRVADEDQAAALDASGSFLIVAQTDAAEILSIVDRPHEIPAEEDALAHAKRGVDELQPSPSGRLKFGEVSKSASGVASLVAKLIDQPQRSCARVVAAHVRKPHLVRPMSPAT